LDLPTKATSGLEGGGRSSLINSIVNRKALARVSSTPGKTRSINFYEVDGFFLVDLPGYGYAKVSRANRRAWQDLIRAYLVRTSLSLAVLLMDIRREVDPDLRELISWFGENQIRFCLVLTKADKVSRSEASLKKKMVQKELPELAQAQIVFSAKTGTGKEELLHVMKVALREFGVNLK
jgi:GTP-binding protein